jgi:hypothetical protein
MSPNVDRTMTLDMRPNWPTYKKLHAWELPCHGVREECVHSHNSPVMQGITKPLAFFFTFWDCDRTTMMQLRALLPKQVFSIRLQSMQGEDFQINWILSP